VSSTPRDLPHAAVWGDLFEISVKRGCLALLQERGLLPTTQHLESWRSHRVDDLHEHLVGQADVVDPNERRRLASTLDHLLFEGWSLGWTVLREALARFGNASLATRGLFCPLSLPDRRPTSRHEDNDDRLLSTFWETFDLAGTADPAWLQRGWPARSDFLLVLRVGQRHHVLVLEFSQHTVPEADDFRESGPHLAELNRFVKRQESRGVFTRIGATLAGEQFVFNDALISHLPALTTRDKPLYKLCQGSSYATVLLSRLARRGQSLTPATAQVIAVTNAGVEALEASFGPEQATPEPRAALMEALGVAYRRTVHLDDGDDGGLAEEIRAVRLHLAQSLPPTLREPFADAFAAPPSDRSIDVRLQETVVGFVNPAQPLARDLLLAGIEDTDAVRAILGDDPRGRIAVACGIGPEESTTLRAVHAAAIRAALSAKRGTITVVAAEGHPGIGKTTAVMDALRAQSDGYLWLYTSPRLVINGDVTRKMARTANGTRAGVLTLTTNHRVIGGARRWWQRQTGNGQSATAPKVAAGDVPGHRFVDAAVIADGFPDLRAPRGSTLFVSPDDGQQIDTEFGGSNFRKEVLDERRDVMKTSKAPGVLGVLARAARDALEKNPDLNRVVLTAAIQGFRGVSGGNSAARASTTVQRLSDLFHSRADLPRGVEERRRWGQRIPTIVVMVDEIAGDGAGAPFVHALASWLYHEFIEPFADELETSPFRVILVLADASLANAAILESYLRHDTTAPEKVIVGPATGSSPFRVSVGTLRLGGHLLPTLHVMADGFPAASLRLDYRVRLDQVDRLPRMDGSNASVRAAILEQYGRRLQRSAVEEIYGALERVPADQQVIFFAQDKRLLRDIQALLVQPDLLATDTDGPVEVGTVRLTNDDIGLLDSSVSESRRRTLTEDATRDAKRVFLMTSSGARGVSFPRAAVIIALIPGFAVESGFMEIAQLIYRGRGASRDARTGEMRSGDCLDRQIVFLLQDFVLADTPIDDRQWLRRTIDLLSALILLRATIFTRITGNAAIPGQAATVVPVGRIGAEEMTLSLSSALHQFLHESAVYLHDSVPPPLRVLVDRARGDVAEIFRNLDWGGTFRDASRRSTVTPAFVQTLSNRVCAPVAPLLNPVGELTLPEQVYGLGPIWLERWDDVDSEERFRIPVRVVGEQRQIRELRNRLVAIGKQSDLPDALRRGARDLLVMVDRPEALSDRSFSTGRVIDSNHVWVCLPLDYVRFCGDTKDGASESMALEDQELWLDGLYRAVATSATPTAAQPVLPTFSDRPFLVVLATGDPTGLARVFDSRYFMASAELNLLNTILFVGDPCET